MQYFKKPNVFTLLIAVAAVGFLFRLANVATFSPAVAVVAESQEEPPLITGADVAEKAAEKAVEKEDRKDAAAAPQEEDAPRAFSTAELEVLQSLSKRRDSLGLRDQALTEREALLKAAEQEVDSKITELNKLKADMERLLGQQQKEEEARIQSLVKIYENMKPKEAARIFDTLEMDILLDVVGRMNERKVSPILASMNPDTAREITIKLAEERRLPVRHTAVP